MKYRFSLLSAFFLLPFFLFAQTNYRPGYIVTLKGDTVHGFVDYKEWNKNPKDIHFKTSLAAGNTGNYTIKNSSGFAVNDLEYYQRFVLTVSQDAVDISKLETKPDTSFITDTVFLRIITTGKHLTLYSYTDDIKPHYYVMESGENQPKELIFHVFYNPAESTSVQQINRYRTQLENLAQKYGINDNKVREQIVQAGYTESELLKIVQLLNGTSAKQFTPQNLLGIRFFAGAGAFYNTINFEGNISFKNSAVSPKISAGLDLLPNKTIQRLFLRGEIGFTTGSYQLRNTINGNPTSLNLSQYTISFTPQLFYNAYNTELLKVFICAGVSINLSSYNNYNFTEQFSNLSTLVINKYPGLEKSWESFPIKTGVLLNKKLEIYIGYTPAANISNTLSSDNSVGTLTNWQGGVNYLFGGK